jgi:antitoxin HicB
MKSKRRSKSRSLNQVTEVDEVAIRLRIEALDEGGYVATSPDVPGLVAEGRSITETVEIAQGLTRKIVESCLEHGDPLPPALTRLRRTSLELRVPVGVR